MDKHIIGWLVLSGFLLSGLGCQSQSGGQRTIAPAPRVTT
jgi:hypothetical protein